MSQQTINVGTGPSTGDGETIRAAFIKANSNFTDAYTHIGSTNNPHAVTAAQVGAIPVSDLAVASGVATLGSDSKLSSAQVPAVVPSANTLANPRGIILAGDLSGNTTFDGSTGVTITATLAASGVMAGTYSSVVVDAKGRILSGGTASGGVATITLTGDITGTSSNGTLAATLAASGVTAGTYTSVVVDTKGRVTSGTFVASGGSTNATLTTLTVTSGASVSGGLTSDNSTINGTLTFPYNDFGFKIDLGSNSSAGVSAGIGSDQNSLSIVHSGGMSFRGTYGGTAFASISSGGTITATAFSGTATRATALTTAQPIALSGDLTGTANFAGNTGATIAATLAASGVTAGTYNLLTVNAKGLVTSATYSAAAAGNLTITGDITGVETDGTLAATFAGTGVTAGTYSAFVVNSKGLITQGNNLTATGDVTGMSSGNQIALSLAGTGAAAGTYASVVVNSKGLVSQGNNLTATGDVVGTSSGNQIALSFAGSGATAGTYAAVVINGKGFVTQGNNLTVTGDVTGTSSGNQVALTLQSSGAVAGTYNTVVINAKGLVTSASNVLATSGTLTLSGDVSGSGVNNGTITATLAATGVTAGTYNSVVVNSKGLVTSATVVTATSGTLTITGDVTASGANNGTITATLAASGATAGTFSAFAVNSKGLITSGINMTATGDVTGTAVGSSIALSLAASGATAGTYNTVVVNAKGIVTSATNVSSSGTLTLTGDITGSGGNSGTITATLAASGVTAGTYRGLIVNAKGLITSALSTVSLPTTTFTGVANLMSYTEATSSPAISSGTLTLDLSVASLAQVTLNANVTSVVLTNVPTSGLVGSLLVLFTMNGTAYTVTWPTSFKWPGGSAPTLTSTAGKKDAYSFFTVDGGTTYQALIVGQNF